LRFEGAGKTAAAEVPAVELLPEEVLRLVPRPRPFSPRLQSGADAAACDRRGGDPSPRGRARRALRARAPRGRVAARRRSPARSADLDLRRRLAAPLKCGSGCAEAMTTSRRLP